MMAQQASRIDKLSFGGERLVGNWLVHLKPSSFPIATECEVTSIAHPITRYANFLTLLYGKNGLGTAFGKIR